MNSAIQNLDLVKMRIGRLVSCALLLCVAEQSGPAQALIRIGETWQYYKARDARSTARPGWQLPSFNDRRWESAPSGYVFDDPKSQSLLRPGRHPGYAYIRKSFTIAAPAKIKSLVLRVEFERAFIAYLNGTEVAREPKVGALRQILRTEVARGFPTSLEGQFDLSRFVGLLKPGENVLAIEGPFSTEGSIAVPITASLLANFTRGPFIQNATTNSMQVIWRTLLPGDSTVYYGTGTNLNLRRYDARPKTDHVLTLTNLLPGQPYSYAVRSETGTDVMTSEPQQFKTSSDSGPVQFIAMGDSGQGTWGQWRMSEVIRAANPDLVLHCGDLVYQGFNDRTVDWRLFNYYQPQMATTPYFMAVGNHDLNCCVGDGAPDYSPTNWFLNATNFQNSFYLPTNSVTGTEHFYSFDAGDAHFVALYNPWFADYDFARDSQQFGWFTNDLAHSDKPWKFIFMHMPLATSGAHFDRDDNTNSLNDSAELMKLILPAAERYGVQLVLGGHDHNFERFAPTNGVHHLVTGGGGGTVYELKQRHPASAQFWATNHCTRVSMSNDTALVEALDLDGRVFDSFVIHRSFPRDKVYDATWGTPRVENIGARDADGNIPGQRFDLQGEPALAKSGDWSNLGRAFFQNDDRHLFIGLRDVMIYGDSTIYLFVGSTRREGVKSMAKLGNGIVDATRQGADGLDFLENVAFTNFTPAIACILGDEFGDGQMPDFKRESARVAVGQGVYRLEPALSPLLEARVQQFNRSPQGFAVTNESSADFIEVAIPLDALGNPKPDDIVTIAAIVASGDVDVARQKQVIDAAGLAVSVEIDPQGNTTVSPIRVRLAKKPAP